MSVPSTWPQPLDYFEMPLVIEPSAGQFSSDAGLLPVRQFDERIGLTQAFADALLKGPGDRNLAGYEDQNDHDTLRADPVFKLIAGRPPDDPDLASQPTLSRFENAISIQSAGSSGN